MLQLANRISVRVRFILGFSAAFLWILLLGGASVHQLGSVERATTDLRDGSLRAIVALARINQDAERLRSAQQLLAIAVAEERCQALQSDLATERQRAQASLALYQSTGTAAGAKPLADALAAAWTRYAQLSDQFVSMTTGSVRGPHRRSAEADRRDRRPDQPAGAERDDRGRARRRCRQGVRGGRGRGEGPGWSTAKATEEIAAHVRQIQDATAETVAAVQGIGAVVGRVGAIAAGIATAVDQQSAATVEIARNLQQAALGTHTVSDSISQISQTAEATGESAGQVLAAASHLAGQADLLTDEMSQFGAKFRAA